MSASLDMSLDDIIRNKTRSEGHSRDSRRKPRVSGHGPDRCAPFRDQPRTKPYPVRPQIPMLPVEVPAWQSQVIPTGGSEVEAKLYISNLDYGVSNEDIKVLFSEVGELKRYSINYDKSGRSKGTAEVVFFSQREALTAIKRYNNVQLDGKPMIIELVGANVVMSPPVPPAIHRTQSGILRAPNMASRWDQENTGGRGWVHGSVGGRNGPNLGGASRRFAEGRGAGGGFAGGHGAGGGRPTGKKLSAEDLDADLDNYHLEATRIK